MVNDRLETAISYAKEKHAGQVDKAGVEYINHPLAVMESVESEDEKIVAVLHDTVEDTDATIEEIKELFGETVARAVECLTHRKCEDYFDYVSRVKENEIARKVKLADLRHNMTLSRLTEVTDKDIQRLRKYEKAKEMLESK